MRTIIYSLLISLPLVGAASAQSFEYAYTPDNGRLLASNCFVCHGINGANSKAFEAIAGESDIYNELSEMGASVSSDPEEALMAVHARALMKFGGTNGANGPRTEMRLISDYLASQTASGGGSGGGDDEGDDETPATQTLDVSKANPSFGTVTSKPSGISCGTGCSSLTANFTTGTLVTLTAKPIKGRRFIGWSGACTGTKPVCVLAMSAARTISASFR